MIRALAAGFVPGLVLALLAAPALAWGPEGHRVVADVAAAHIRPATRAAIDALLAGERDPTLAGIANWADEIRPFRPETGPLHYINMPRGECRYLPARDCPDGLCVVAAIEHSVAVLRGGDATSAERRVALKNLVHFVADLHQPLHAGFADDRGGNDYPVQWQRHRDSLHRLWDSGLIASIDPDDQRLAAQLEPQAASLELRTLDPADWAEASCGIAAADDFYPADHHPGAAYAARWQPVVERQLTLAGLRLAAWLDALF